MESNLQVGMERGGVAVEGFFIFYFFIFFQQKKASSKAGAHQLRGC
jgi:hypothetical protein